MKKREVLPFAEFVHHPPENLFAMVCSRGTFPLLVKALEMMGNRKEFTDQG